MARLAGQCIIPQHRDSGDGRNAAMALSLRSRLHRLVGLSRRRRTARSHLRRFSGWHCDLGRGPVRLRIRTIRVDPSCRRTVVRGACRLPRHARPREADHAGWGLADRVLDHRGLCGRRHSLDAHGMAPRSPDTGRRQGLNSAGTTRWSEAGWRTSGPLSRRRFRSMIGH